MRLFVAVDLDPVVAAAASAVIDDLRARAGRLAPRARISWIPPERLHLTVRFIGHVGEAQAAAIGSALAAPLQAAAFELTLAGVGAFPRAGAPRVLWAGVERGPATLQAIEREVTRRLERLGMPPEARPYHPHLTLGRVREAGGLRTAALLAGLEATLLGTTRVGTITLYESRLSPRGPAYHAVQQIPLHDR